MLFIFVFGYQSRAGVVDTGRFYCPLCRKKRRYKLRQSRRHVTLYFIPAIPLGEGAEYVECDHCSATFLPDVLTAELQADAEKRDAEYLAQYLRAIQLVLVYMVAADGKATPAEMAAMRKIYRTVTDQEIVDEELRAALDRSSRGPPLKFFRALSKLSRQLNDKGKEAIVETAVLIAAADGELGKPEIGLIKNIGSFLGMKRSHVRSIISSTSA